jgi:ABC-type proline/glycine betaine transport system ATPase subunit
MRKKNAGFIKIDDKKFKIKNDCDVRTNNGYVI